MPGPPRLAFSLWMALITSDNENNNFKIDHNIFDVVEDNLDV